MTSTNIHNPNDIQPLRLHYIDWLRILAVLLLIPFHTARIFDIWEPFYAKSEQVSEALSHIFIGAVNSWHMPLFFLLAGASTWFALRFRSGGDYVKERFKRLIIPLTFGVLVIVAPQTYFGARTYGYFNGSFLQYYPKFFQIGASGDLTGYMGGFTPGHLWFILFLFVFSSVAFPLFVYLRGEAGKRLIAKLAAFFMRPGMIFLLAVPLVLAAVLPDVGGKNPFYYLTLFIYGYVLVADARFGETLERYRVLALILGLSTLATLIVLMESGIPIPEWLGVVLDLFYVSFMAWFFLIAILGFGQRYLNFTNWALKYASEAAYPFYILHQTVIVIIGFYAVQWNVGVLTKFLIIVIAAMVTTTLVYDLLVKRTNVTRFLFGMKPRAKKPIGLAFAKTGVQAPYQ